MYAVGDGPDSYETLKREEALARHLVERGEITRAIEFVDHALRGLSGIHGDDHPDLGAVLQTRAAAFLVLQGQMYGRASLTCDDASPVFPATRHFSSI